MSSAGRFLKPAIKLLVLAAVVWFVWGTLRSGMGDLDRTDWQCRYGWLAVAGLLYLIGLAPAAFFWHRILAAFGQCPSFGSTIRAYYIGHLGKYVPGKALVVVLRSGLLAERGVAAGPGVVSVFVETLLMMAVGAAVAAGIGAVYLNDQPGVILGGVALALVAGLPTTPPVLRWILKHRWAARLVDAPSGDRSEQSNPPQVSWRLVGTGWILNIVGWVILGTSLWTVLRSLVVVGDMPANPLPLCIAAVALAMVAGFLSGLPGGIGVRDGILVAIIARIVPEETALVAAVLLRVVWLLSEVGISAILYLGWKSPHSQNRAG